MPDILFWIQEEADMDQRPNCRIWDGGYDGSESGDDLKPQDCDSNVDDHSMVDSTHGIASFLSLAQWLCKCRKTNKKKE